MSWYTIKTSPNTEAKVQRLIMATKTRDETINKSIEEVLVPEEHFFVYKDGERKVAKRRMYANYVFIRGSITSDNGDLLPELIDFFATIPGMKGFMGGYTPMAMKPEEAESMLMQAQAKDVVSRFNFSVGETVKVKEGPFMSMKAKVKGYNTETNNLLVEVEIFGRLTTVSLTPEQVEKVSE
jgi:transcriptional antiterminator NusG